MTKNSLHSINSLHNHYIKQHSSKVITHRYVY